MSQHHRVVIVGGGFGGIGMAVKLLEDGERDFVVLERAADVGGVWRDNSYPGCACDVQSQVYSFSWALNPSWSRAFSPSAEIWKYLRDVAERFGVMPHMRFGHDLREAHWDDDARIWRITTSQGEMTADLVVSAVGALSNPSIPKLPGLERFQGKVMHSARWDHDHDLRGKNVAVIGTGASAIQFVPEIQPKVGKLSVFQRTAPWVVPRGDAAIPERRKRLYAKVPALQRLSREVVYHLRELTVIPFMRPPLMRVLQKVAERHLERQVPDPVLRKKLTPNYTMGCKRILVSDDYLRSLGRPNVDVVTSGIAEIREHSIVDKSGVEHAVDTIVLGTGFEVTDIAIGKQIFGRGGKSLTEAWGNSMRAYLGTTVHGFPNLFLLLGPNTGLGHNSVVVMIEAQITHVRKAIQWMKTKGLATLEPKRHVQDAYVADIDAKLARTVWNAGGCASWYLDATGRNSTLWPGSTIAFRRAVTHFDPSKYAAAHVVESRRRVETRTNGAAAAVA